MATPTPQQAEAQYRKLVAAIDSGRVGTSVKEISAFGNRLAGSLGEQKTFDYAEALFRKLGFKSVRREPFAVTVPDPDARGVLTLGSGPITLFPLWPNVVKTSTCDVSGSLVYGGSGTLKALSGKRIDGSIVVLEFDSGVGWRNAAKLGARAIVFLEPRTTTRAEAELKFSAAPLGVPRFYLPIAEAGPVLRAAFRGETGRLACRQDWVVRQSCNLIADLPGHDPTADAERVLLLADADAMCIAPGLALGSGSTAGIAAMLEMAELWRLHPHRRPVTFVLSGAHGLSLQGVREFVDRRLETDRMPLLLAITLDMSPGSGTLASCGRGWYYEYRDEALSPLINMSRLLRQHADILSRIYGLPSGRLALADAVNNSDNRSWKNNISSPFAFDCEPFVSAGYNALTFATVEDSRERLDTPFDTVDHVNFANIARQTQTLAAMLGSVLNDTSDPHEPSDFRIPLDVVRPQRLKLTGGFSTVDGYVALYDPARSFVPDLRVEDALAVAWHQEKTMLGVRGAIVQRVSSGGHYSLPGLTPVSAYAIPARRRKTLLAAFHLDSAGDIDEGPDLGVSGAESYPVLFELKTTHRTSPIVLFRCRAVSLYDLVDPQEFKPFQSTEVLDAATNGPPQSFGLFLPFEDPRLKSELEDTAVLLVQPGHRFKLLMGSGFGEQRLILTNSSTADETGKGYLAPGEAPTGERGQAENGVFPQTALNSAVDIATINATRLKSFAKFRIISGSADELNNRALEEIHLARESQSKLLWTEADRHARAAWGYALRAHPVVQGASNDVVNGVIFYLFLIIPFSYFVERLLFGCRALTKQLMVSIGVFVLSFLGLRLIHPAFEIVTNPMMIFVAFVMGVLSLVVTAFILGKFETSLKEMRQAASGLHEVDIRRGSVAMAAFNLGISNMRRRKARTVLTTLTLVVMTFIVLSFTSIVPDLKFNELPSPTAARYSGILLRDAGMEPLQGSTYRALRDEFGNSAHVGRRAIYYGADTDNVGVLSLRRADQIADVRAILGLDPEEGLISHPQDALLKGGRWFDDQDEKVVILPRPLAEQLKVGAAEVGKATISYAGSDYTVIGIVDPSTLRSYVDLDGDGLLPPDFALSKQFQQASQSGAKAFRHFLRVDPSACVLMPARTALEGGAELRSVGVSFADPLETRKALDAMMPRLRLNLYAAVPTAGGLQVRQFSVLQSSKGQGLALILVQLAIAAIFVLNTMIASVFERTREIAIFSAIGLAPNHIAMLFFAESLVYGVLGAVGGYLVAQVVAKIVVSTHSLPGLYLNFSSGSAVMSAALVMGVVLASTIYPARKASKIAAPALSEQVFETGPEGDTWTLPLPFSVNSSEAEPLVAYLAAWLRAYEEYTIGNFVTSGTAIESEAPDRFAVHTKAWIAPYDLGVSQELTIQAIPSQVAGVHLLHLVLVRLSGEPDSWITVNRRFLADLRKVFLTWRTSAPSPAGGGPVSASEQG